MTFPPTIKRQLIVAAYTSPVVSVLTATPVVMLSGSQTRDYIVTILFFTGVVFFMWVINIGVYFFLNRRREDTGRVWRRYVLSYVLCLVLAGGALHGLLNSMSQPVMDQAMGYAGLHIKGAGFHFHVIAFFAIDTVILILQDLAVTRTRNAAMAMENVRLRMHNMEAVNMQLKQQLQPHFLFNSLSTLKSLIGRSPELAEEYLVRLAGFLRAAAATSSVNLVKVEKELELCSDYLEMQRIRFGNALQFSIDVPAEVREGMYLPVFSLQLLLENAIKHNAISVEQPLRVWIVYRSGVITVKNDLQKKEDEELSAGTGLANLQERYKALSGRFGYTGPGVSIERGEGYFSVGINVLANASGDH